MKCFHILHLVLILAMLAFTHNAVADQNPYDTACKKFDQADARLNAIYKKVLSHIEKQEAQDYFVDTQRAWVAFRDSESEFRASLFNKGGIVYATAAKDASTRLTEERIAQLKAIEKELEAR